MTSAPARIAGRHARALVPLVALCIALLAFAAPASAAEMGVSAELTSGASRPEIDREVALLRDLHARWIRADVPWDSLEYSGKGSHTDARLLSSIDYAMAQVHAAGVQVEMVVEGTPFWASSDPAKYSDAAGYHYNRNYPPSNPQDYADFMTWIVGHFRALGVHVYEIWDEPNLAYFWLPGPDAPAYVQLLRTAYPAVHAADPGATVLMGGLFTSDYDYLQAMYAAGAKPYFDGANVHPYSGPVGPLGCFHNHADPSRKPKTAFCGINEIRRTMLANGDGAKKLWLTELSYATYTGDLGVTPAAQSQYLTQAYRGVQGLSWVKAMFWYELDDTQGQNPFNSNLGLIGTNRVPKPSYFAFRSYAIATDGGLHAPRKACRPRKHHRCPKAHKHKRHHRKRRR